MARPLERINPDVVCALTLGGHRVHAGNGAACLHRAAGLGDFGYGVSPSEVPLDSHGMITVSVIIPAYNAASHLAATLRSASAQTVRDLEVIVVDDGSDDETSAVGKALATSDDRIRIIRCANGELRERATSGGIQQPRGRFVAPLDADDLWHPRKLELQLGRFDERPYAGRATTGSGGSMKSTASSSVRHVPASRAGCCIATC